MSFVTLICMRSGACCMGEGCLKGVVRVAYDLDI